MKNYIVEKRMVASNAGYYVVVVEGETHLNKLEISSKEQMFSLEAGYDYNHPWPKAFQFATAIAKGLNDLEKLKHEQRRIIVDHPDYEY